MIFYSEKLIIVRGADLSEFFSLIFIGKMCVFVSRPLKIVTFPLESEKANQKGQPQEGKCQTAQQQFEYRVNGKTGDGQTVPLLHRGFLREGAPDSQI